MPTRFEKYRMRDGVTPLSERYFNPLLQDLDARIADIEALKISWADAVSEVTSFGLVRINAALVPTLEQSSALLDQLLSDAQGFRDSVMAEVNAAVVPLINSIKPALAVATTYDSQGRVNTVTETLPTGDRVTTASYDASGRVATLVIVFGGVTRTETYTYSASGQLTGMSASEV